MFFYAVLVLTCLLVTLIIIRLRNSISSSIDYRSSRSSTKKSNSGSTSKARVQQNYLKPMKPIGAPPAKPDNPVPWGWPGNKQEIREHRPKIPASGDTDLNSYLRRKRGGLQSTEKRQQNAGKNSSGGRSTAAGNVYKSDRKATPKSIKPRTGDRIWG